MDENREIRLWIVACATICCVAMVAAASPEVRDIIGQLFFVVAIVVGVLVPPAVIWRFVRSVNRIDDPRHVEPPPDPP